MSNNQKSLRTISIVVMVIGLVYVIEGLIVSGNKSSYFIAAALTIFCGVICYLAATDAGKAKLARILLWITVIANFIGVVGGVITHAGGVMIGASVVDLCVAVYMLQLIKKIYG